MKNYFENRAIGAMAAEPERLSQESSAYGQIGFEERQSLLINAGWGE